MLTELESKIIVIKFGGNALNDKTIKQFASSVKKLIKYKIKPVIVHGGGPQINEMLEKLNIKSTFINGLRYTNKDTIKVAEMVLSGAVNKKIVKHLNNLNINAVGISGKDANTLIAQKKIKDQNNNSIDLGYVGDITRIDTNLINLLLNNNYIPVISPIASDINGDTLNINADYAASAIAKSIPAHTFIMMTNINGLLNNKSELINKITPEDILSMIDESIIKDGMIPKTLSAIEALDTVSEVKIINGNNSDNLIACLSGELTGTTIAKY